jgi:hypothetical protein
MANDEKTQPLVPKGCGTLLAIAAVVTAFFLWRNYF